MRISDWSSDVCSSDLLDQRRAQLSRVAGLAVVVALVGGLRLCRQLGIVGDVPTAVAHRAAVEEVGAEEDGLDDGDVNAERLELRRKGLREALDGDRKSTRLHSSH